ncbi:DUF928 domain-containing protein [Pseudanabaenaceae cyanobacterium LEGE 13415]|nr:DUF928 domain-containing protein [Pseudanabaenaceae cyanobacterium LEGE 13415]
MGVQTAGSFFAIAVLIAGIQPGFSQSTTQKIAQSPNPVILFKPPPEDGTPSTTRGAGSRDNQQCPQDSSSTTKTTGKPSLTALVPSDRRGLTWSARPTFWVYVPQTSAQQIVLSIKQGNQFHSQRFLPITGTPGIISIQAAEDSPPLEVGKTYQWAIVLVCGNRPSPNDPAVSAWIRREQSPAPSNSQSVLQQAANYSDRGIWYDALTVLAQAKRSQPTNSALSETWTSFLRQPSVGLEAISTQPLR